MSERGHEWLFVDAVLKVEVREHTEDDSDMACLASDSISDAAIETNSSDAGAVFISCTAIRAAEVVKRLKRHLAKA